MLFATIKASSQTIDTTVKHCVAAKINVKQVTDNNLQTTSITHLGVLGYNDNLMGTCTVDFALIANNKNIIVTSITLTEEEYNSWNGEDYKIGILAIIGNRIKVTFK